MKCKYTNQREKNQLVTKNNKELAHDSNHGRQLVVHQQPRLFFENEREQLQRLIVGLCLSLDNRSNDDEHSSAHPWQTLPSHRGRTTCFCVAQTSGSNISDESYHLVSLKDDYARDNGRSINKWTGRNIKYSSSAAPNVCLWERSLCFWFVFIRVDNHLSE